MREKQPTGALPTEPLAFGKFRLDLAAQRLWHGRQPVELRRKAWQVLVHLAQRPDVLVSNDELLDAVWPGIAVTPNTLTNVIGELRRALRDRGTAPRIIETVHRRGYRFIASSGSEPTAAASPQEANGFVGRGAELAQLAAAWRQALRGQRQIVFVTGEPGIGKTTLVDRFIADSIEASGSPRAAAGKPWRGRALCIEQHGAAESYMPVLEIVEGLARGRDAARVAALLRRCAPTWLAQIPSLVPPPEMVALRTSLLGIGAARMLREGVTALEALAAARPLLLVIEDLHWSDPATPDLITALAQRTEPARLMVLGTYRPVDAVVHDHRIAAVARQLRLHRQALQLALSPFTAAEVRACIAQRVGDSTIGTRLAAVIERQSGGNPLFVRALIAHLIAEDRLQQRDGTWTLAAAAKDLDLGVPDDLGGLIATQLATLPKSTVALLEAASVEGDEFSLRGVAAGVAQPAARVEDRLQEVARRQTPIQPHGERAWPDGGLDARYRFTHAVYRRAVYDRIAPSKRRQLHQRVGECLEAAYGDQAADHAAELAVHFEAADDVARRARYRELEAANASVRFAHTDAVAHLTEGLRQLRRLKPNRERRRREAQLELTLGNAVTVAAGSTAPAVLEAYTRAERLARDAGAPRERFRALLGIGSIHFVAGSVFAVEPVVGEQLAMARTVTPTLAGQAYWRAGQLHLAKGELTTARDYLEQSLRADGEAGIPVVLDFRACAGAELALTLALLGHVEQSRKACAAALRRSDEAGLPFSRCHTMWLAILVAAVQHDEAAARDLARRGADMAERFGFATFRAMRSWSLPARRRDAVRLREAALADNQAVAGRWYDAVNIARLAQACLDAGDPAAALRWVERGFDDVRDLGQRWYEAELWRLRGEALRRKKLATDAETAFRRAIDVARAQGAKLLEARATASLRKDNRGLRGSKSG